MKNSAFNACLALAFLAVWVPAVRSATFTAGTFSYVQLRPRLRCVKGMRAIIEIIVINVVSGAFMDVVAESCD